MFLFLAIKKPVGKTKEELALEKKRELEKRLQDVSGQLNSTKKPPKKGEYLILQATASSLYSALSIAFFLTNGHQLYMFSTFNVQLCYCVLSEWKNRVVIRTASSGVTPQRFQLQLRFQLLLFIFLLFWHQWFRLRLRGQARWGRRLRRTGPLDYPAPPLYPLLWHFLISPSSPHCRRAGSAGGRDTGTFYRRREHNGQNKIWVSSPNESNLLA